jgi:hypothetical protein
MFDLSKARTYPFAERRNLASLTDFVRPKDSPILRQSGDVHSLRSIMCAGAKQGPALPFHMDECGMGLLPDGRPEPGSAMHPAMNGAASHCDFSAYVNHRQSVATVRRKLLEPTGG